MLGDLSQSSPTPDLFFFPSLILSERVEYESLGNVPQAGKAIESDGL